jgi:hypothetical protein
MNNSIHGPNWFRDLPPLPLHGFTGVVGLGRPNTVFGLLRYPTPMVDPQIADLVNAAKARLLGVLPEERRCVLLTGSWAAGEGTTMSDVDLDLVWIASPQNEGIWEMRAVQTAAEDIDRMSGGRVELANSTLRDLSLRWRAWRVPRLQSPSILIDGVDLRRQLPVPPIDMYVGSMADRAKEMIARIRGQKAHTLTLPLVVPDAQAPYLGYETPRTWYPPEVEAGSREVYDLVAACGSALYVKGSHIMVNSKRQGMDGFISSSNGWGSFVGDVRDLVLRLNYALPQSEEDREQLRKICEQLINFEAYTLDQLQEEFQ